MTMLQTRWKKHRFTEKKQKTLFYLLRIILSAYFRCRIYHTLQRTNNEKLKQIFPEMELRDHSPNYHIHVSVSDLYFSTIDLPILLQEICGPIQ